jgi:hypothetical protein
LIFADDPDEYAAKKMPGLSDRRANRAGLKRKLLMELWNEDINAAPDGAAGLFIPRPVLDVMEERLILREDVMDVINSSRLSGRRFYNTEDESYLAGFRKKNVTYWVRWAEKDGGDHIISVYSHRMKVNE